MTEAYSLIKRLESEGTLTDKELCSLLFDIEDGGDVEEHLFSSARMACEGVYGKAVYIRGLIEFTSVCKNNCLYCGLRAGNSLAQRYRLTKDEILTCCDNGYAVGFRTFVLQGGEDPFFDDGVLCDIVKSIKSRFPENSVAVTLSIGERTRDSYAKLKAAGADRYLLRHESASAEHYSMLHPKGMALAPRMECLENLKALGFQTGCGFMVGSPYQTEENIISDLRYIEKLRPHMVGIGPFIPHKDTPFASFPSGSVNLTLRILSVVRLMNRAVLLPATTALGTAEKGGRERGILAGANVVMPNLSPPSVREKYMLYNGKLSSGNEAAEGISLLAESFKKIDRIIAFERGDSKV